MTSRPSWTEWLPTNRRPFAQRQKGCPHHCRQPFAVRAARKGARSVHAGCAGHCLNRTWSTLRARTWSTDKAPEPPHSHTGWTWYTPCKWTRSTPGKASSCAGAMQTIARSCPHLRRHPFAVRAARKGARRVHKGPNNGTICAKKAENVHKGPEAGTICTRARIFLEKCLSLHVEY